MRKQDFWSAAIGTVLSVVLVGYFLFYVPMKGNLDECGRVTLCPSEMQP